MYFPLLSSKLHFLDTTEDIKNRKTNSSLTTSIIAKGILSEIFLKLKDVSKIFYYKSVTLFERLVDWLAASPMKNQRVIHEQIKWLIYYWIC